MKTLRRGRKDGRLMYRIPKRRISSAKYSIVSKPSCSVLVATILRFFFFKGCSQPRQLQGRLFAGFPVVIGVVTLIQAHGVSRFALWPTKQINNGYLLARKK